ncbi:hypothetical protein C2S51_017535 [Perilla frutescens var. frutescens]|nr:hypothetical protein C2S51_017535 [Perilla frutescens var. frutescens]
MEATAFLFIFILSLEVTSLGQPISMAWNTHARRINKSPFTGGKPHKHTSTKLEGKLRRAQFTRQIDLLCRGSLRALSNLGGVEITQKRSKEAGETQIKQRAERNSGSNQRSGRNPENRKSQRLERGTRRTTIPAGKGCPRRNPVALIPLLGIRAVERFTFLRFHRVRPSLDVAHATPPFELTAAEADKGGRRGRLAQVTHKFPELLIDDRNAQGFKRITTEVIGDRPKTGSPTDLLGKPLVTQPLTLQQGYSITEIQGSRRK